MRFYFQKQQRQQHQQNMQRQLSLDNPYQQNEYQNQLNYHQDQRRHHSNDRRNDYQQNYGRVFFSFIIGRWFVIILRCHTHSKLRSKLQCKYFQNTMLNIYYLGLLTGSYILTYVL